MRAGRLIRFPLSVIALSISITDGTIDPDMNEYADEMD
jgi:hypothetical protein